MSAHEDDEFPQSAPMAGSFFVFEKANIQWKLLKFHVQRSAMFIQLAQIFDKNVNAY
ncbi:hypothetical protein [Methylobacterium haplocladii]|uniref:hypothetical protein n=1 Tax=Methylobacterium haplocladii TaxID=1176176 RepID=UPI001478BA7D|nr:hypothetical protein [Methylobacterium haplocladii]